MKIKTILNEPSWKSLIYMERYINDGSPSGFTYTHACSKEYSPRHGKSSFKVPIIYSNNIKQYSFNHGSLINKNVRIGIPIHPDFAKNIQINSFKWDLSSFDNYPTASSRTLLSINDSEKFYIKLHYDGILCRVKRSLPYRKAIAEVEMSKFFEKYIDRNSIENFGFLKSPFCNTYFAEKEIDQFSAIIREFIPFPYIKESRYLIPFFSLFSQDIFNPNDRSILFQLLESYKNPEEVFLDKIIFPIIENFVNLIKREGFIPEINAQNLLLEVNDKMEIKRIIFRDLMGVEKDLSIRDSLDLSNNFDSISYKTISKDDSLYFKRHSFSYDFKLSKYVIEPLVLNFALSFNKTPNELNKAIREKARDFWGKFQYEFFKPTDIWYSHPKTLLVEKSKRVYLENTNPMYR